MRAGELSTQTRKHPRRQPAPSQRQFMKAAIIGACLVRVLALPVSIVRCPPSCAAKATPVQAKSEIRGPKSEGNPKTEGRKELLPMGGLHASAVPGSDLGLRASFGFRVSVLGFHVRRPLPTFHQPCAKAALKATPKPVTKPCTSQALPYCSHVDAINMGATRLWLACNRLCTGLQVAWGWLMRRGLEPRRPDTMIGSLRQPCAASDTLIGITGEI